MKIIHCGHVPVPEGHPQRQYMGAVHPGRWVLNHAIAQKNAGMDVEVVTQAHKAKCDFICEIEGVKVHFLRTYHPYRHFTFYAIDQFRMASYVRNLHPDIVHAHGTEAAYAMAAIRTGLPFCITAQGLFFQIIPALGHKPDLNMRFQRISENWAWKRTHYAIAKSEYVRDALATQYPYLDIELIPNTYERNLDATHTVDQHNRGHSLAFVGTMDRRKGVHLIAEAMETVLKSFPDVKLHIIGNPPEETASGYIGEQLRRLRSTLGANLVLHGRLPSQDVFAVLDGCGALLSPSYEEMFGNQLIEGLMRGCHGIVTEGTALAENVRRFGNGTVIPQNDAAAMSKVICDTMSALPSIEETETTRCAIRAYMSPEFVAAKHNAFYKRVLDGANAN